MLVHVVGLYTGGAYIRGAYIRRFTVSSPCTIENIDYFQMRLAVSQLYVGCVAVIKKTWDARKLHSEKMSSSFHLDIKWVYLQAGKGYPWSLTSRMGSLHHKVPG